MGIWLSEGNGNTLRTSVPCPQQRRSGGRLGDAWTKMTLVGGGSTGPPSVPLDASAPPSRASASGLTETSAADESALLPASNTLVSGPKLASAAPYGGEAV